MADDDGSLLWSLLKGGLIVFGGLAAIGLVVSVLKPLFIIGVLGGAGYLGYRLLSKPKELGPGQGSAKALPADDDFERRMRELDAMDRKLDAEIKKR